MQNFKQIIVILFLHNIINTIHAQIAIAPIVNIAITNGIFETPDIASGTFQYAPAGSGWNFYSTSGISDNGSGFTSCNPNAPSAVR